MEKGILKNQELFHKIKSIEKLHRNLQILQEIKAKMRLRECVLD